MRGSRRSEQRHDHLSDQTTLVPSPDAGAWSGQGTALVHVGAEISKDESTDFDTVVLTGEGAYEGLTAYVLADWTEEPVAVEGAVFVGEAPPFPESASATESEPAE